MNQFTTASLQSAIIRYKNLTVGDVRPDATTKLYKRMFKETGRRYIPVKDVTNDDAGRELNAYLINPEYIDKSVIDPGFVSQRLTPTPVVRAVQYSRLTHTRPAVTRSKRIINRTAALFAIATKVGQRAITSIRKAAPKARRTLLYTPINRTYSVRRGMALHARQKRLAGAGSIAAIVSFGIIGLQGINLQQPVSQPSPEVAPTNSLIESPISNVNTSPSQPIPIFNTGAASNPGTSGNYSAQTPMKQHPITNSIQQPANSAAAVLSPVQTTITTATPDSAPNPAVNETVPDQVINVPPEVVTEEPMVDDTILAPVVNDVVDVTTATLSEVQNVVDILAGSN